MIQPKPWSNALTRCAGHPEFSLEFLRDMGILRQQRYARPSATLQHFHVLMPCLKLRRCDFCIRNDVDVHGVIEADNLLIHLLSNAFLPVCLQGSRCQTRLCSSEQRPAAFFAARNVSRGPLPPPPPLFLLPLMHLFTHYKHFQTCLHCLTSSMIKTRRAAPLVGTAAFSPSLEQYVLRLLVALRQQRRWRERDAASRHRSRVVIYCR